MPGRRTAAGLHSTAACSMRKSPSSASTDAACGRCACPACRDPTPWPGRRTGAGSRSRRGRIRRRAGSGSWAPTGVGCTAS
jgi:hypothetical protein